MTRQQTFPLRAWPGALRLVALAALTLLTGAGPATATSDPSAICDQVASEAARRTGVPLSVLKAISLTETGRKHGGAFRPWPWTVNMEGEGHWFTTEDEARAYVYREYKRGARSFDVGCFQLNYKWHGQAFRSIDEMFDPLANALYAARFLNDLHTEKGDWSRAAGAYHSRTPEFADRYTARFERLHAALTGDHGPEIPEIPDIVAVAHAGASAGARAAAPAAVVRVNRYPLLLSAAPGSAGAATRLGSLVPLGNRGGAGLLAVSAARNDPATDSPAID